MNIWGLQHNQRPEMAAALLAMEGISVLPCAGKRPALANWQQFQQRAATSAQVARWHSAGLFGNVGIICGAVSRNLVVIDLDGQLAVSAFAEKWPDLMDTYRVLSGSGQGQHIYFFVRHLPPTTRVTLGSHYNYELRANGCYVVAPPSVHPETGQRYAALTDRPVRFVDTLEPVREWIHGMIREKYRDMPPPRPLPPLRPKAWTTREAYMREAWLRGAMQRELNAVATAPAGTRNNALYKAAVVLGQLIAGGELAAGNVEAALINAAASAGLDSDEAGRTVQSGFRAGAQKPRRVPAAPPRRNA